MRLLFPRNLFHFSPSFSSAPPLLLRVSHFSISSSYPSSSRRYDDESRNVRVSVWWDFENCNLPADVNVCKIANSITEAVRAKGIRGPIQITAFGDILQLSRAKQEALSSTGVNLTHIPNGGKNSADRSLLVDLMYWVSQNPPPAHLFLISGDRDFAGILHRLRMNNYNILIASPERAPGVLCSAATIMWHWNSLLKGENLTGKHFNHPPDGPFGSWYGHHKVPLEDPFSDGEQSTCSQSEMISEPVADLKFRQIPRAVTRHIQHILYSHPKGISVSELRAELAKTDMHLDKDYYGYRKFSRFLLSVPRVKLQFGSDGRLYVHCFPKKSPEPFGSSVVDKEELKHVAISKLNGEGEDMVRDADGTPLMASSHEPSVEDIPEKVQQVGDAANAQVTENQLPSKENEILSSSSVSQSVTEKYTTLENYSAEQSYTVVEKNGILNDRSEKLKAKEDYVKPARKEADAGCCIPYSSPVDESVIDKRIGGSTETNSYNFRRSLTFFGWIKSWWPFWKTGGNSDDLTAHQNEMVSNTEEPKLSNLNQKVSHFEESKLSHLKRTVSHSEGPKLSELKQAASHSEEPGLLKQAVSHSEEPELSEVKQTVSHSEGPKLSELKQAASHSEEPELLKQAVSHSEEPELSEVKQTVSHSEDPDLSEVRQTVSHSREPNSSELRQTASPSGESELFFSSSFWSDMEAFAFTSKGSILVSQSRSRADLAHNFQKYGTLVLRSLSENDLLQLVGLLISEKKWLEERPSQTFPFRLTPPAGKSLMGLSHGANGLRSLFLSRTTQSNLQKSSECDVDKKHQSIPHTGVSSPATKRKHTGRSRNDMLADIQKLVNEILREHPEGYNMGSFRKLFLERYDYPLDVQKLGYQKLASLLQIMPGLKIESTYIFPTDHAICASGLETSILNTQETNTGVAVSNSDSELSDSSPKDDSNDSSWEELGPVSVSNSNQSDLESKLKQKAIELEMSMHPDYEPSLSDDDSSESEGDSSSLTQPEVKGKPKYDVDDSSLLQTLESWYSSKEGEDSVKKLENGKTMGNVLTDGLTPSRQSTTGTHSRIESREYREKQKSLKSYSFVADPVSNKKDELIDGIIHSLKKDELKMQN